MRSTRTCDVPTTLDVKSSVVLPGREESVTRKLAGPQTHPGSRLGSSLGSLKASPAVTLLLFFCGLLYGQKKSTGVEDAELRSRLEGIAGGHHGKVAIFAKQLNTGKTVAIAADTPVQTASVIKLAVLFEAMEEVRSGKASWDEQLTLKKGDAVSGSGVLMFFDTPLTLTMKDVLTMMVIVSDNTATNLMIDRLGIDAVNARIGWMGLRETHLYKRIMKPSTGPLPADQPRFGLGKTTAREMARVMERIGRCELAGPGETVSAAHPVQDQAICGVAMTMLRNQFYRTTIPRYVETLDSTEAGSAIANKTGSLDAVRNDVGIVAAKSGPIVISIFTYANMDRSWTPDNEGEVTVARMAKEIVAAWSPEGIDPARMVPGLGLAGGNDGAAVASQ